MDLYETPAMRRFSDCAMTAYQCVPPLPADEVQEKAFEEARRRVATLPSLPSPPPLGSFLRGEWRVSLGLNPTFDTFPCQRHFFAPPSPNAAAATEATARFTYRVPRSGGSRPLLRSDGRTFTVPDPANPRFWRVKPDPPYLGYVESWLFLGGQPNDPSDPWFAVRYFGRNAAWSGFGGANVYTRSGLPPAAPGAVEAMERALEIGGMKREDMVAVDNRCEEEEGFVWVSRWQTRLGVGRAAPFK